jgi:hypothetical protein
MSLVTHGSQNSQIVWCNFMSQLRPAGVAIALLIVIRFPFAFAAWQKVDKAPKCTVVGHCWAPVISN